jgi:hypothetical protein
MHALLGHILLFASALSMTGPQGWCCLVAFPNKAKSVPAPRPACPCQQCAEPREPTPDEQPQPTVPCRPCCDCVQGALVVVKESFHSVPDVSHLAAVAAADYFPSWETPAVGLSLPPPSRSLQLLHCVWRC